MSKNILVSWSGGFDSTYMIIDLLKKGNNVKAIQIQSPNLVASKIEVERTELITPFLQKMGDFTHNIVYQEYGDVFPFCLPQLPIFLFNLSLASNVDTNKVNIGYVMNDDAISFLPEIKKIWKSLGLMKKLPPLEFPLIKINKRDIISILMNEYKEIYDLCWCCESESDVMCGKCPSCKRHISSGGLTNDEDKIKENSK